MDDIKVNDIVMIREFGNYKHLQKLVFKVLKVKENADCLIQVIKNNSFTIGNVSKSKTKKYLGSCKCKPSYYSGKVNCNNCIGDKIKRYCDFKPDFYINQKGDKILLDNETYTQDTVTGSKGIQYKKNSLIDVQFTFSIFSLIKNRSIKNG
jgi:hypothetical protein